MQQLLLGVTIALLALVGTSALPQSGAAGSLPENWPPLSAACNDVSGDGQVDLLNDIVGVIGHYGTTWGDDDYALVYDVSGGGTVDLLNDIMGVIGSYGQTCSLVDTQVVRSALALLPYRDCQDAVADGYDASGLYVPQMGIHISKPSNLKTTFDPNSWEDLANPFGLVCSRVSDTGEGRYIPDKLIGPWYIIPVESTADVYNTYFGTNLTPPYQLDDVPPAGFATDEDYIDYVGLGAQAGWHTHVNLCVGFNPHFLQEQGPSGSQSTCEAVGGALNIPLYGWMLHLYNFVPNPEGRFMRWNVNPDFANCGYSSISNWPNC